MIQTPPWDADRPGEDAFSDILEAARLRGVRVVRHDEGNPGSPAVPRDGLHLLIPEAGQLELRHGASDVSATALRVGDLAMVTARAPVRLRPGTGARWMLGEVSLQPSGTAAFAALPALTVVREDSARTWAAASRDLLAAELDRPRPGSRVMVSRILDLLVIHMVRAGATADGVDGPGALAGALDPPIGSVLSRIHRRPGHPWTVAEMARAANLSRTAFADRFVSLVGRPPGAYVRHHRLEVARHRLEQGRESIDAISRSVGYSSPAAFSRAFTASQGMSPARWRQRSTGTGRADGAAGGDLDARREAADPARG